MKKNVVNPVLAAAWVLLAAACQTIQTRNVRTTADYPRENRKVMSVVKTSGEVIRFSKANPGRIMNKAVVGNAVVIEKEPVELTGPFPLIKKYSNGTVYEVTDAAGQTHSVKKVLKEETDKMTVRAVYPVSGRVSILLAEVKSLRIESVNGPLTMLAVLSALVGVYFIGMAIAFASG